MINISMKTFSCSSSNTQLGLNCDHVIGSGTIKKYCIVGIFFLELNFKESHSIYMDLLNGFHM